MGSQKEDSRAIGWTDGTNLYGKKRWNIIFYPYSSPANCLSLFTRNPPKNITVVKSLGSAFATAQTLHGIVPSKELLNALPTGAEGQVASNNLPHTISPITKRKARVAVHKNPINEIKNGGIPQMGQIFPLR